FRNIGGWLDRASFVFCLPLLVLILHSGANVINQNRGYEGYLIVSLIKKIGSQINLLLLHRPFKRLMGKHISRFHRQQRRRRHRAIREFCACLINEHSRLSDGHYSRWSTPWLALSRGRGQTDNCSLPV